MYIPKDFLVFEKDLVLALYILLDLFIIQLNL
jgi:hypothetical protein